MPIMAPFNPIQDDEFEALAWAMKKERLQREVGRIIPLMLGEEAAMHIRIQHRTWERSFERAIREAGLENCGRNLLESLMERALSASEEQAKAEKQAKACLERVRLNRGHDSEEERCPICMDDFALEVSRMPCSHSFHESCIVRWLKRNQVCPLCRFKLPSV